jgi:hypothetical protein
MSASSWARGTSRARPHTGWPAAPGGGVMMERTRADGGSRRAPRCSGWPCWERGRGRGPRVLVTMDVFTVEQRGGDGHALPRSRTPSSGPPGSSTGQVFDSAEAWREGVLELPMVDGRPDPAPAARHADHRGPGSGAGGAGGRRGPHARGRDWPGLELEPPGWSWTSPSWPGAAGGGAVDGNGLAALRCSWLLRSHPRRWRPGVPGGGVAAGDPGRLPRERPGRAAPPRSHARAPDPAPAGLRRPGGRASWGGPGASTSGSVTRSWFRSS